MLINDASITGSLIVNASASLQNISLGGNIIPDETNLRNLGSTDKYFKEIYVSTGSINFVDGGTIVAVLNSDTLGTLQNNTASANSRLTAIESVSASLQLFTASISTTNTFTSSATARLNALETSSASVDTLNTTQSNRLGSLETISASNISRIGSIETITSSNISRLSALETTSASVDTLNTTQNTRLTNLEIKTGSLATTGSNTFIGTQTITGSLYISSDLVVQGSSSLQNITASAVSIGTNIVNLNTANPAIRYAGLVIGDSGSVGGSGSFLYDSVQDEMIFVHRGTSTVVTSSVVLMGPQTFDTIGTETYPTANRIQKGTGNEHLVDSCIIDDGTTVCVNANLRGSSTISGTSLRSNGVGTFGFNTANNGEFQIYGTALDGIIMAGRGSSNDMVITNKNGSDVFRIPTGTIISNFIGNVCAPSFVLANGNCITAIRNTGGASIGVLGFTSGTDTLFIKGGTSGAAASIQFQDTGGTMATFYNCRLGIGTITPGTALEVVSKAADADRTIPHNVLTLTAEQGNAPYGFFGGAILFKNRSYTSGMVESARIRSVIYDDGAPANCGGGLWFETTSTPGGTLTPSLAINYEGRVSIGTQTPVEPLTVSFAAHGIISQHRQSCGVGVGQNFYMKFNNVVGAAVNYAGIYADIQGNTNGAHNGRMILQVANAGNLLSALTISNNGAVSTACCLSVGSSADASGGFGTMIAYQPYGAASFSCNLNTLADGTYIVTASMVRGGAAINETYSAMWIYHHYASSGGTDIINTIVSSTAPGNNNGALSLSGTTVSIGWGGARGPASISALRLRTS